MDCNSILRFSNAFAGPLDVAISFMLFAVLVGLWQISFPEFCVQLCLEKQDCRNRWCWEGGTHVRWYLRIQSLSICYGQ